jgi:hypothetical protein
MIYTCAVCNYETLRKVDLERHLNKKRPCKPKITTSSAKKETVDVNDVRKREPVDVNDVYNVNDDIKNALNKNESNIKPNQCSKCLRIFTRKDHMRVHERKCDGFDKKTCKICLKKLQVHKVNTNI